MKKKTIDDFYPSKADGKIPAFDSYEEEANFWDTHSITDFEDQTENVEIIFDLKKLRDATLIVRLQKRLKDKLSKLAKSKGTGTSSMARKFIIDGLRSELAR